MPFYCYKCSFCGEIQEKYHSIKIILEDCEKCNSKKSLIRIPPTEFNLLNELKEQKKQNRVGDITKEFIEQAREELKEQKKDIIKGR